MAAPEEKPFAENGKVTLSVPHNVGVGDSLSVRVTVGTLPKGARIVVRSGTGEVLGSIAPFGQAANRPGVFYTIPVPSELAADRKISLCFTLEEPGGEKSRVPSGAEVREIKLQSTGER
jgi:hypothetical protein